MPTHHVTYRATGRFAPIVCDYIEGSRALREFYTRTPDKKGLEDALSSRQFDPGMRATLCTAINQGYSGVEVPPAVRKNIDALRREGTFTVTTGHQLCLFTGPLYVPFKILNTVRLAAELSTAQRPVVPVFWMATEDHDRDEIDHVRVAGTKLSWPGSAGGAVGRMKLKGIEALLAELDPLLGSGPHAEELRAILRSAYQEERTLAEATRHFVNALFGRFGVVVVDGDDPALKRAFAPIMQEELLNEVAARSVRYANEKLEPHYTIQAHVRDLNLFHMRPGHRSRIERDGDQYKVLDDGPVFTLDNLVIELQLRPQQFSPNVLLRPVYQETVLPNIAYVGGGGELAYWLQLRWLFQALQVPMPALLLRTSAAFLSEKQAARVRSLGLEIADLFTSKVELEKRVALERASFSTSLNEERSAHSQFYTDLAVRAKAADPSLEASVGARAAQALKGLDKIERQLVRAAKQQQADALRQLGEVLTTLFPDGLQERSDNFMPWYAAEGPAFFDRLLEALDPLDPQFSVIEG